MVNDIMTFWSHFRDLKIPHLDVWVDLGVDNDWGMSAGVIQAPPTHQSPDDYRLQISPI